MFRSEAIKAIHLQRGTRQPLEGFLDIVIKLYPPNRRVFDIDNLVKGIFDSLMHARVVTDDSQFRRLLIEDTGELAGVVEVYIQQHVLSSTLNK